MLVLLALFVGLGLAAQRPANSSTCDYYAELRYGVNNNVSQFQLVQGIVSLAFGGSFNLSNISSEITGILNPGNLNDLAVDLRPWFNGSIPSTNLNDQAVGIDWLDDGGVDPLYNYLSGATPNVVLTNTTNEYRLFHHFFSAFSHIFGCTEPPPAGPPSTGGSLSLAYVHKYMNLNFTDLGHFIDQLSRATVEFGFSEQDSQTFATNLNSQYNVRCAPPITTNPTLGPQLLSLCQASTCPLAEPNPDCAAYVNLTANGIGSGVPQPSQASSTSSSSTGPATVTVSPSVTQTPTTAATTSAASKSSSTLSAGGIAGTVIGGVAVLLLGVGAIIFLLRKRRGPRVEPGWPTPTGYGSPVSPAQAHMSYSASDNNYTVASSNNPILAEMESPHPPQQPEMGYIQSVERGERRIDQM